jgi:acyl carrier protein
MDTYRNAAMLLASHPNVVRVELVETNSGTDSGLSTIVVAQVTGNVTSVLLREHLRSALGGEAILPPLVVGGTLEEVIEEARRMTPVEIQRLSYERPRDDLETLLAELWTDVLRLPAVSVNDSFIGIGGDSSTMVTLIADLERDLGTGIDLFEFMDASSVREQAAVLRRTGAWDDRLAHAVRSAWRDVVGGGVVGLRDDFFDVGGTLDSAIRLSIVLCQASGRDIQVGFISDNRTILEQIRALAALQ